LGCII
jgi:hypothetical protein